MNIFRHALLALGSTLVFVAATAVHAQTAQPAASPATAKATFAGGCFWCMEHPFDILPGVVSTTSGYIGGQKKNPTYEEVSAGRSAPTDAGPLGSHPYKRSC